MTIDVSTFVLWIFCEFCNCQSQHHFITDDGKYEVYACEHCGKQVRYAVR
jgi:hypothetical protein